MDHLQISAHLEMTSFIRSAWMRNGACHQDLMMDLFEVLVRAGCDYYDLLDLYSDHSFSEIDLGVFAKQSPVPKTILPITPQNIRGSIFRWSASKYHTNSIAKVVEDIYNSLLLGKSGIAVYNSNQNPRSRQSLNDKYILLIVKDENLFFDISRKSTVKFQKE